MIVEVFINSYNNIFFCDYCNVGASVNNVTDDWYFKSITDHVGKKYDWVLVNILVMHMKKRVVISTMIIIKHLHWSWINWINYTNTFKWLQLQDLCDISKLYVCTIHFWLLRKWIYLLKKSYAVRVWYTVILYILYIL